MSEALAIWLLLQGTALGRSHVVLAADGRVTVIKRHTAWAITRGGKVVAACHPERLGK